MLHVARHLDALEGKQGLLPALRRLRPPLIRLKLKLLDPLLWHAQPPEDVAAAFPDVVSGARARS